jgi:hypothetical protein
MSIQNSLVVLGGKEYEEKDSRHVVFLECHGKKQDVERVSLSFKDNELTLAAHPYLLLNSLGDFL